MLGIGYSYNEWPVYFCVHGFDRIGASLMRCIRHNTLLCLTTSHWEVVFFCKKKARMATGVIKKSMYCAY